MRRRPRSNRAVAHAWVPRGGDRLLIGVPINTRASDLRNTRPGAYRSERQSQSRALIRVRKVRQASAELAVLPFSRRHALLVRNGIQNRQSNRICRTFPTCQLCRSRSRCVGSRKNCHARLFKAVRVLPRHKQDAPSRVRRLQPLPLEPRRVHLRRLHARFARRRTRRVFFNIYRRPRGWTPRGGALTFPREISTRGGPRRP